MSYVAVGQTAKALEQLRVALSLEPNPGLKEKIQQRARTIGELVGRRGIQIRASRAPGRNFRPNNCANEFVKNPSGCS